jgi:type I restriction enzyme M protein
LVFALRGVEGQFFTPRNVVRAVVAMANPQPGEMIIDPAAVMADFFTQGGEFGREVVPRA